MKDLLFGWLFKNKFELTGLEEIIGAIFIILVIIQLIIFIIIKLKGE